VEKEEEREGAAASPGEKARTAARKEGNELATVATILVIRSQTSRKETPLAALV
jgi:hypothetical protein